MHILASKMVYNTLTHWHIRHW